jgi:hypothetical protein
MRRWHLVTLIVVAILVGLYSILYFLDPYIRFENVGRYGWKAYDKEIFFSQNYPSEEDVRARLDDVTILASSPPNNIVFYFDNRDQYVEWIGDRLSFGSWKLRPIIKIMRYNSRMRVTSATIICYWHYDMPAAAQLENCSVVQSLDHLVQSYSNASHEYRKGNVFGLSKGKSAPMRLPISAISIDSLLSSIQSKP